MGIGEAKEIVPIALVETRKRGQYEHRLLVSDRVDGRREIIHMVMYHRWRCPATAGRSDRLPERGCWRGKRVRGGIVELSSCGRNGGGIRRGREQEDEEAEGENSCEDNGYRTRPSQRPGQRHACKVGTTSCWPTLFL